MVDTPPSRSALDFLDAPKRLGSFLDGRLIRVLAAPARGAGRMSARVFSASLGLFTSALSKVIGAQVLRDMQLFVSSFDALFGVFGSAQIRRSRIAGPGYPLPGGGGAWSPTPCAKPHTSSSALSPRACRWPGWCSIGSRKCGCLS